MASFDGSEIRELVELYIQKNPENILPKSNFGLYQDDELFSETVMASKWTKREKISHISRTYWL